MNFSEKMAINFQCDKPGLIIEDFLTTKTISGRLFRKLYKEKKILVNGRVVNKREKLKNNDQVCIILDDEVNNIEHEPMNLDIVYEDHDLLVINKNSNIVVHPTKSHQEGTLSNGISYYFKENNINRKIRFVNRLDMDTSGLLIIAKHAFAHQQMAIQFERENIDKRYFAIVKGTIKKDSDYIDSPIGREEEGSIRKMVRDDGQSALTKYKVVERYKDATLLEIQLLTGRSHQIRVHLNYIGHPIIGDSLYYEKSDYINRQALHSYFLGIRNIREKEKIELYAKMPKDMEDLIAKLKR